MTARRQRIEHDHARGVVVSSLKISLLELSETQTAARFVVAPVLIEQVAKDLFRLNVFAFAHGAIALAVRLFVGRSVGRRSSTGGDEQTKHKSGQTAGRRSEQTPVVFTLHDSHLLNAIHRLRRFFFFSYLP